MYAREEFPYSSIYPVLGDRDTFHNKPNTTQVGYILYLGIGIHFIINQIQHR